VAEDPACPHAPSVDANDLARLYRRTEIWRPFYIPGHHRPALTSPPSSDHKSENIVPNYGRGSDGSTGSDVDLSHRGRAGQLVRGGAAIENAAHNRQPQRIRAGSRRSAIAVRNKPLAVGAAGTNSNCPLYTPEVIPPQPALLRSQPCKSPKAEGNQLRLTRGRTWISTAGIQDLRGASSQAAQGFCRCSHLPKFD
jgi:hypothetical protein